MDDRHDDPRSPEIAETRRLGLLYCWDLPQSEIDDQREKVLRRTMDIGTLQDIFAAERVFGRRQLATVLAGSDAGAMTPRSWSFWHHRLGLIAPGHKPPPMPSRRLA